jgi:hypothetical protein
VDANTAATSPCATELTRRFEDCGLPSKGRFVPTPKSRAIRTSTLSHDLHDAVQYVTVRFRPALRGRDTGAVERPHHVVRWPVPSLRT